MQVSSLVAVAKRCAYCNEPFRLSSRRLEVYPVDSQFVCSEFCAQALREEVQVLQVRRTAS
jgi:hypothetical protein